MGQMIYVRSGFVDDLEITLSWADLLPTSMMILAVVTVPILSWQLKTLKAVWK